MPRWICPHCDATMTVKPDLIGQVRKCVKCAHSSEVTDADAVALMLQDDDESPARPETTPPAPHKDQVTGTAKTVAIIMAMINIGSGIWSTASGWPLGPIALGFAIAFAGQLTVLWPFFSLVEDTRRIRNMLELQKPRD